MRIKRVAIVVGAILLIPLVLTLLNRNSHVRGGQGGGWDWNLIGIIPIRRSGSALENMRDDPLKPAADALAKGSILIIYPEGTRGAPERLAKFKNGVAHLVERFPHVPVTPVYIGGLGKAWPKGERWPVPLLCEVFVDPPLKWCGDRAAFIAALEARVASMAKLGDFPGWDHEPSAAADKRALEREGEQGDGEAGRRK